METLLPIVKENSITIYKNTIGAFHDAIIKGKVVNAITREPILAKVVIVDFSGYPISSETQTDIDGYFYINASISDVNPAVNDTSTDVDYIRITPIDGKKYDVPQPAAIDFAQFGLFTGDLYGNSITLTQKTTVPLALVGAGLIAFGLINSKEKKAIGVSVPTNNTTKELVNVGLIIGGGYLLFNSINIIDKILQLFGISKSAATKAIDFASSDPNSFWNPNFWRKFTSYTYAIDENQANAIIAQIMDAMSTFTPDDVSAVYGALFQLQTQANLSFLCYVFQQTQGQDFLTWLRGTVWPNDRLDDAEIYVIHQHFMNLPTH